MAWNVEAHRLSVWIDYLGNEPKALQGSDSNGRPGKFTCNSHKLAVELGTMIFSSESIALLKVDAEVLGESWELFKQRREIHLSFTDCTTAVLARHHGIADILTYDSDFQALGFVVLPKIGFA